VSRQLDGCRCTPTVVAEPRAAGNGRWSVETSYLAPTGWKSLELYGDDESVDGKGEEWKETQ
jgi:hypothetical protein